MKLRLLLISVLLFATLVTPRVQAQDTRTEEIAARCSLAQGYLKNIQKPRDLRARVDLLQGYRYIASRMETFVQRLERNGQPMAQQLRSSLEDLTLKTDTFRDRYEVYDKAREDVAKLTDCSKNVSEFQEKLGVARQKRQEVNDSVTEIQTLLDTTTRSQLSELYTELLATSKSAGGNQ